jgi:hypothetical protein
VKSNAIIKLERGTDGPPTNERTIHRVILSVVVEGVDKPMTQPIGEFYDGFSDIAKQFVDWFNSKLAGGGA